MVSFGIRLWRINCSLLNCDNYRVLGSVSTLPPAVRGHPYVAGFALFSFSAAATMPTWGVRPQMFSPLFASIFISFLDRYYRREVMPSIWWLAPLMILWVNLHAGFVLGLVLIILTIAGLLLDGLLREGFLRRRLV